MTNQERMRALLDERAQQARRQDEQHSSRQANSLARARWWATRRGNKMRSRQRRSS